MTTKSKAAGVRSRAASRANLKFNYTPGASVAKFMTVRLPEGALAAARVPENSERASLLALAVRNG